MRVIFLGTPEFGEICMQAILNSKHQVVAAVCQPDKPSGRGNKLVPPPVKILAIKNNIPVYQFNKIRKEGNEVLKNLNADIMVTAAYGQILSQEIIDICKHKIINVHGSLLPKLRGASPIQYALINGDEETGITIMKTEAGVDTGDMILSESVKIQPDDTYETLSQKLANIGARLIVKALDMIENNTAVFTPQKHELATFTKMIKKEHTLLDFNKNAINLVNLTRALNPNPSAYFNLLGESFKVFSLKPVITEQSAPNGTIIEASGKKGLIIKCEGGAVEVLELMPPNSKKMSAKSYLNGKQVKVGTIVNA